MKGKIVFNCDVTPMGVAPPIEGEDISRPYADYDGKEAIYKYRKGDLDDMKLFKLFEECFATPEPDVYDKEKKAVRFEIKDENNKKSGRSVLDWIQDVQGTLYGYGKLLMLNGVFSYLVANQDGVKVEEQITIKSRKIENMEKGREYYKYKEGSNTIYIPPIIIYWGCFGKDVKIKLADNTEKCASDMQVNDKVISYDNKVLTVSDAVVGEDATICLIKTKNKEIKVSGGHPVMCEGECKIAARLKIGDKLNVVGGGLEEIVSIETLEYNDKVYNFAFEESGENGTYIIADGFFAGDLHLQNKRPEKKEIVFTAEDKQLIAEAMIHSVETDAKIGYVE